MFLQVCQLADYIVKRDRMVTFDVDIISRIHIRTFVDEDD